MPSYDYRCKDCQRRFSLFYKTYAEYDEAAKTCPHCGSESVTRLISRVAVPKPSHNFTNMDSDDMLSVLESGDSRQVGEMFRQISGDDPEMGEEFNQVTDRLLKGESMESIEKDLGDSDPGGGDLL
jgi:putative FmdB family regulatory protein